MSEKWLKIVKIGVFLAGPMRILEGFSQKIPKNRSFSDPILTEMHDFGTHFPVRAKLPYIQGVPEKRTRDLEIGSQWGQNGSKWCKNDPFPVLFWHHFIWSRAKWTVGYIPYTLRGQKCDFTIFTQNPQKPIEPGGPKAILAWWTKWLILRQNDQNDWFYAKMTKKWLISMPKWPKKWLIFHAKMTDFPC